MKNHLKRIASPRTWVINRKEGKFIVRPKPGAHSLENGLPLGVILREKLGFASTMGEVKKILNNKTVLVDGKRRKDHRYIAGLFDVVSVPEVSKYYRITFDQKGRLVVLKITEEESNYKLSKVVSKTSLRGKKIQLNLHDSKNIISDQKVKVGDTLMLRLPDLEIKKVLPLKEGATVFLTKGKHAGSMGILKEIKGEEVIYSVDQVDVETAKNYLFVVEKSK